MAGGQSEVVFGVMPGRPGGSFRGAPLPDLPVALIFRIRVKPACKNISSFQKRKSVVWMHHPVPTKRGVSRSSRDVARDAMDASARQTSAHEAYGEIVRSRSPDAGIKFAVMICERRWLSSPDTGEITYKAYNHCAGSAHGFRVRVFDAPVNDDAK
jgi:predicted RNA methylase